MFIWQMPHTFAIAIKRYNEYKKAGVAMLPVVYGFEVTKRQILVYIACLLPLPFFLGSLGTIFILIATLLNIGIFIYSVNYLMILFAMMMIVAWG